VYYKMINKNTLKSAIYWRKRLFNLKMFALRNSPVRYSLYISRLINNNQAPSYRSEWSAFIMNNNKRLEKLLSPFHKIWFHYIKGAALRRGRQWRNRVNEQCTTECIVWSTTDVVYSRITHIQLSQCIFATTSYLL
jgi:hypothetical protein